VLSMYISICSGGLSLNEIHHYIHVKNYINFWKILETPQKRLEASRKFIIFNKPLG